MMKFEDFKKVFDESFNKVTPQEFIFKMETLGYKFIDGESNPVSDIPTNAIFTIRPYKNGDMWVFDDERVGLVREPFVCGMPEIIDFHIDLKPWLWKTSDGFNLIFSETPMPNHDTVLTWCHDEDGGAIYKDITSLKVGWLCPALFKYFKTAPKQLYIQFK